MSIPVEKTTQAVSILNDLNLDCWLTFVRETTESGDPVLPLILGQPVTWQSAFLITRDDKRIAIVGKFEDEAVRSSGAFDEIVPYVEGISRPLVETLTRLNPSSIAINHSTNDVKADGLTYGMFQLLCGYLDGTPYVSRLCTAEAIIRALRGRKSQSELDRMRSAYATTEGIFAAVQSRAKPGMTERTIWEFMHVQARSRGVDVAWEEAMCPIVTTGPNSMVGHGLPSESLSITPGQVFHIDFGVRQNDYCSDIQRSWYVPKAGETKPPDDVQRAFETTRDAIHRAFAALKPGVEGWQIDAIARRTVTDAGYPEYQHATGHHVGRAAHDGGGVVGPKWERYGRTPFYLLEPGNVITLELGIDVPSRGYLGLEEMVLVTEDGADWISEPQTELELLAT